MKMRGGSVLLLTYLYKPELRERSIMKYFTLLGLAPHLPFDLYFVQPLSRIFERVFVYDYVERMLDIGVTGANEELVALVRHERPRFVVWTPWEYEMQGSTLEAIRREGSALIGWFFDDEWRFDEYSKWWIPYLDYCVTNALDAVPKYEALGARVVHTIPNTGTLVKHAWTDPIEQYDVSFVGSIYYADRRRFINRLRRAGIPLNLFGKGSEAGYVTFERMVELFQTTKINLNFSKDWNHLQPQIKGRVFQTCLAGGFVLTEYVPGLENYFELEKEVACFRNEDELVDKIRYYLRHDAERHKVAQAGWHRASHQYTSSAMVAKVFAEIERDKLSKRQNDSSSSTASRLPVPILVRWRQSRFHFRRARAFLESGCPKQFWKMSLDLALAANRFNMSARYYQLAGALPHRARRPLLVGYAAFDRIVAAIVQVSIGHLAWLRKRTRQLTRLIFRA